MSFRYEFNFLLSCFQAWVWDGQPELMTYDPDAYTASFLMVDGKTLAVFPVNGSLVYKVLPAP